MAENNESGLVYKAKVFFRESWAELKKVTWPAPKDIWASSLVVVGFVTVFTLITMAVDLLLSKGVGLIIK